MNEDQRLGLEANIPRIKAQRWLEKASMGEVDFNANGWYDLTLLATGSREAAEKAHNDYIRRCYREGRTPQ